jgi:hypothetical protein
LESHAHYYYPYRYSYYYQRKKLDLVEGYVGKKNEAPHALPKVETRSP